MTSTPIFYSQGQPCEGGDKLRADVQQRAGNKGPGVDGGKPCLWLPLCTSAALSPGGRHGGQAWSPRSLALLGSVGGCCQTDEQTLPPVPGRPPA